MARHPEPGTVVRSRRNRETGTVIDVVYSPHADEGRDPASGSMPWETICVDHGTVCSHATRALARSFAAVPTEWCEDCQAQYSTEGKGSWDDFADSVVH